MTENVGIAAHVVKVAMESRNSSAAALKSRVAMRKKASYTCRHQVLHINIG